MIGAEFVGKPKDPHVQVSPLSQAEMKALDGRIGNTDEGAIE
jgi:hypothetical protein